VRQAGVCWGMSLIYAYRPSVVLKKSILKSLAFFKQYSKTSVDGARYVCYPDENAGATGTVALVALAHIDFLQAVKNEISKDVRAQLEKDLDSYMAFLIKAQRDDGLWHSRYRLADGMPYGAPSPYFDGESLLALVKAAKYSGREDLWPAILKGADAGYSWNIQDALKIDPDSNITKGYYQWSSMAFYEITTSKRKNVGKYGEYVMDSADWMIDVHKTLERRRNTAYAYEGIIHAYAIADKLAATERKKKYLDTINKGMFKLTSWQVGSSVANKYIRSVKHEDLKAIGGVQNHKKECTLRIDVAQHQMHAVLLALKCVFEQ
jgi:UDP-N-acetylmuramoyl-tripeptide--D-alanyl-D-alanine ligase